MELTDFFLAMMAYVRANVLPKSFAEKLIVDLEFFAGQAKYNSDLKINPEYLRVRWDQFALSVKGTGLLEKFAKQSESWASVQNFVSGQPVKRPMRVVNSQQPNQPPKQPLNWEMDRLLHHLLSQAVRTPTLMGEEKIILLLGLKYLLSEAERPKAKRDRKWILSTWRTVHPILQKTKMLEPFRSESIVRERVRQFVGGR